jgi:DNA polymerase (family 10)
MAEGGSITTKQRVVAAFEEISRLMELTEENPFKIRSYVNAARTIANLEEDLDALVKEGRLKEIPGVGDALADKIATLVTTGHLPFLEELRAQFPSTIFELFRVPSLGAKRIKQFYDELGIKSLAELKAAAEENRLVALKGMNAKSQAKILEGIAMAGESKSQFLYPEAAHAAEALLVYMRACPHVQRCEAAGSLRRRKELVKDIDIVASSAAPSAVMDYFVAYPLASKVTGHGEAKSSIITEAGIAADLRVVPDDIFPCTLLHFTGSKEHNVVLRQRAKDRGLKLNEYGLQREDGSGLEYRDEADIYAALGLPYLPPEIREDMGEFELSETPRLVTPEDVRGVIHCHSTYSDGRNTLREMVEAAMKVGYQYLLITDHSQTAAYAGGLKPHHIIAQHEEIDALNQELEGFTVLKGIESDILLNGALDYPDEILRSFDLVVGSIHSRLDMPEDEATARIVKAIENPCCDIIGHLTGRLLLQRKGLTVDLDRIFDACVANNTALEINGNALRLDLDWRNVIKGKRRGVKFCVSPDAHRVAQIANIGNAVGIARKGGLGPEDVLSCYTVDELLAWRGPRP